MKTASKVCGMSTPAIGINILEKVLATRMKTDVPPCHFTGRMLLKISSCSVKKLYPSIPTAVHSINDLLNSHHVWYTLSAGTQLII